MELLLRATSPSQPWMFGFCRLASNQKHQLISEAKPEFLGCDANLLWLAHR